MKNINEIGILACGTRMKSLYDTLAQDAKTIYVAHNLKMEAKWFTIIYALVENKEMTVTDLANILGLAHPTIIQYLKELEKIGWVKSSKSKSDRRIRLLRLSDQAKKQVPGLKKVWQQMRQAFESLNNDGQHDFWAGFVEFEAALMKKSLYDRVIEISGRDQQKNLTMHTATHPGQWFDRKFNFKHLSTTPEGLMERLRFSPLRIEEKIKHLTTPQLIKSVDGKWSIQENIGHLNDLEPLWYGRVLDIVNGEKTMRPADLTNKKSHEAEHNKIPVEKIIAEFKANRKKLVSLCEEHFNSITSSSSLHPRLKKPMRIIDLLFFTAEHDDHHIATINYLIDRM